MKLWKLVGLLLLDAEEFFKLFAECCWIYFLRHERHRAHGKGGRQAHKFPKFHFNGSEMASRE